MKKAVKITINGTVQGIFFRNFVKENAEKLSLGGFVRNLEDGRIEIIVEGDNENIKSFIEICKKGLKFASIREIKIEEKSYSGELNEFKIIRF